MNFSSSLSHEQSANFHSFFLASHKISALTEEKVCVSSSLLRSALPAPEAAPAACQTSHRYRGMGNRYKLLFRSVNRQGEKGEVSGTSGESEAKSGDIDLQQQQGIAVFWITIF